MKKKKIVYSILCLIGGIIIGVFANQLSTWWGALLFVAGLMLSLLSISKLAE